MFQIEKVRQVEFGICSETDVEDLVEIVPIDRRLQEALIEALVQTNKHLEGQAEEGDEPSEYSPSEKHAPVENLVTGLDDDLCADIKKLFQAENIPTGRASLDNPERILYYFAFFQGERGRKLLAVKRATYFKGLVKAKSRLARIVDDTMKHVEDDIFKLDNDFDFVVDGQQVHILHPHGFEFVSNAADTILASAADATRNLQKRLPGVAFSRLDSFVSTRKRAARLVASIRSRKDLSKTDPKRLREMCEAHGIDLEEADGAIFPAEGHEMAFLKLLDRRRYTITLTDEEEFYEAPSRKSVK